MADRKLTELDTLPVIDRATDLLYVVDSSSDSSQKMTVNGVLGLSGNPVGDTDTQTLTNKTLTTPVISSIYQDAGKTKLMTLPNVASDTLVSRNSIDTLANKTLVTPTVTSGMNITSGTLAVTSNTTVGGTLAVTGVLTPSAGLSNSSVSNSALAGGITADKNISVSAREYKIFTSAAWTTTSSTPTLITGVTKSITTSGGSIVVFFSVLCTVSANTGIIGLYVDGTLYGYVQVSSTTKVCIPFLNKVDGLTAASHTIEVRASISGGATFTVPQYEACQLFAFEVGKAS